MPQEGVVPRHIAPRKGNERGPRDDEGGTDDFKWCDRIEMGKAELLKQLSKLKKNLKSADPSKKRSTDPYHKAHAINANINEIKGKLANLGHTVNNSNYENDYDNSVSNNSTYSAEAYRTNEHKERSKSKKARKTRRFKALNRYKAKPKTRRHHR